MSKISEAKERQQYNETPERQTCSRCKHFKSDFELPKWVQELNVQRPDDQRTIETHGIEKNLRCEIGGFKVKKTAVCAEFEKQ